MLNKQEIQKVIKYIKAEPRTVQEISKLIKRSWVTTDSYLQQIKIDTGLIDIKTFRKGTQGALKIVYCSQNTTSTGDDLKEQLFNYIKSSKKKTDIDFFEIFQYINDDKKKTLVETNGNKSLAKKNNIVQLLQQTENSLYIFSGNLSFINIFENNVKITDVLEDLLKRKVIIKILCRVNISSINNISKISHLLKKYPELIEIRHWFQPLRGFIIDDKIARFNGEEKIGQYKQGELENNLFILYDIYDSEWIVWLQKIFWNIYRFSIEYSAREKQLKKFF